VAIVDELDAPEGWQMAETVVRAPHQEIACHPGLSNECPAAIRSFFVEADMDGAYLEAKALISDAGFSITDEAAAGCTSGSSTGPPCGFFADRGSDQLYVGIFGSPSAAGLDDGKRGVVAVVIRAYDRAQSS
jgi:hypothetical protein